MRKDQTGWHFLKRISLAGVTAGLVVAAGQAHAYYGGHHGYYGGHHGYYGGHHAYYGGHYGGYYGGHHAYYGGHHAYYGGHHGGYYGGHYGGYGWGYLGSLYYGGYPYRGYGSSGPYYGYSSAPPRRSSPASVYRGESNAAPRSTGGASRETGPGGGWARLADGQYVAALSIFATAATRQPKSGGPKVGYALSAAGAGDLRRGIWAMRRALRIDPHAIHYVRIDAVLRPRIERLIVGYQTKADRISRGSDAAFMRASLYYLLGNAKSARGQVDLSVAAGDRRSSTVNLERLIDEEIDANVRRK